MPAMGTLKRIWDYLMSPPQGYAAETATTQGPARRKLSVMNLRRNDVVTYDGIDYLVQVVMVYSEGGFYWRAYHLIDSVSRKMVWLSAEEDDTLEVALYRPIDLVLEGAVPHSLTWDGDTFRQAEHGRADVKIESESGMKQALAEYWDFESDSGKLLSVERWASETEVSLGQVIEPYQLSLLPGDEVNA